MANGFHGSMEAWELQEAPLRKIDSVLEAFASEHGFVLTRNHHGNPERSLTMAGSISRLIQIFVADEKKPTYKVWLCVSEDRELKRYWKRRFITESATPDELRKCLGDWLRQGHAEIAEWKSQDLSLGGPIEKIP